VNADSPIDLASLAIMIGASFVARGFSGDKDQLVPLIRAGMAHRGAALIDIISPCVAFNNHDGSTRSYDYVREHNEAVNKIEFIPRRDPIEVDQAAGTTRPVMLHDGSTILLAKLGADYDASDPAAALARIAEHQARGEIATGLLYLDPDSSDLHEHLHTVDTPFNMLGAAELVPCPDALDRINARLR